MKLPDRKSNAGIVTRALAAFSLVLMLTTLMGCLKGRGREDSAYQTLPKPPAESK